MRSGEKNAFTSQVNGHHRNQQSVLSEKNVFASQVNGHYHNQ
jgi:hypothetical protein